ncbi:uncharacterized protein LOC136024863 isoform X2 [Artemia franciscana]|uniref:uncharacterized protein LOC136024863 isoform X2 n=1 Tax=Artemia franciscana TaxID=6661 RepID=UPI0032DAED0B
MNLKRFPIFAVLAEILLILMVARCGFCRPHNLPSQSNRENMPKIRQLMNGCSNKFVYLNGNKPRANGAPNTTEGQLYIKPLNIEGRVSIQSVSTRKFLCFSRKGRPELKATFRNKYCEFQEEVMNGYVVYNSAFNDRWSLGFSKKGSPQISSKLKNPKCKRFIKYNVVEKEPEKSVQTMIADFVNSLFDKNLLHKISSKTVSDKKKDDFSESTFAKDVLEPVLPKKRKDRIERWVSGTIKHQRKKGSDNVAQTLRVDAKTRTRETGGNRRLKKKYRSRSVNGDQT